MWNKIIMERVIILFLFPHFCLICGWSREQASGSPIGGPTRTNVAYRKPATQSNDVQYAGWIWTADYAVEGCTDRNMPDLQQCCSSSIQTYIETENKWSVNLEGLYIIDLIIIFGRNDTTTQLERFQINYLDTDGITELNLYTDQGNNYGNVDFGLFEIPVDPVIITRSIIIRRPEILTLCEVEVYGVPFNVSSASTTEPTSPTTMPACLDGFYGINCTNRCSDGCAINTVCNKTTGVCTEGCESGYYGHMCIQCGNCLINAPCDSTTGICLAGCADGWRGDYCTEACPNRTFGQNCSEECGQYIDTCNFVNGSCSSNCLVGWQGELCYTAIKQDPDGSGDTNIGAIVGGVLGGVALLIIIFVAYKLLQRRTPPKRSSASYFTWLHRNPEVTIQTKADEGVYDNIEVERPQVLGIKTKTK